LRCLRTGDICLVHIPDPTLLEPLAHTLDGQAEQLRRTIAQVRDRAALLHWNSPAGAASADTVQVLLAAAQGCQHGCVVAAQALRDHRRAAARHAEVLLQVQLAPADLARRVVRLLS